MGFEEASQNQIQVIIHDKNWPLFKGVLVTSLKMEDKGRGPLVEFETKVGGFT